MEMFLEDNLSEDVVIQSDPKGDSRWGGYEPMVRWGVGLDV